MPVRGGDFIQAPGKHYCEKRGLIRPCSVVCSGAATVVKSREPLRGCRRCVRFRTSGSYNMPVKSADEPCESRATPGSLASAHSVEAAPAGRRHIDWTGEVRNDRSPETNFMRRPMAIVRGATEPSSAVEARNRARRNFGKCLPPRTARSPWAPRRTTSSYTLERVVTTIVSRAAHESM